MARLYMLRLDELLTKAVTDASALEQEVARLRGLEHRLKWPRIATENVDFNQVYNTIDSFQLRKVAPFYKLSIIFTQYIIYTY